MKNYLVFVGFCLSLAILFEITASFMPSGGTVTVVHEEVQIEFVQEETAMNEWEYSTFELRASR